MKNQFDPADPQRRAHIGAAGRCRPGDRDGLEQARHGDYRLMMAWRDQLGDFAAGMRRRTQEAGRTVGERVMPGLDI